MIIIRNQNLITGVAILLIIVLIELTGVFKKSSDTQYIRIPASQLQFIAPPSASPAPAQPNTAVSDALYIMNGTSNAAAEAAAIAAAAVAAEQAGRVGLRST